MRAGGDKLGDSAGEGGVGSDVEDGYGVSAFLHAALSEDHGDEMHACLFEKRHGGGGGEEAGIGGRDVAYDVGGVVDDSYGSEAFVGH